jgi:superfamily II DNA or RNA helicase
MWQRGRPKFRRAGHEPHLDVPKYNTREPSSWGAVLYWAERSTASGERLDLPQTGTTEGGPDSPWQLTSGLNPHAWQLECSNRWFASGGRGVVKVVTGAGKTVLACRILERLRNEREPGPRAAIVVPTMQYADTFPGHAACWCAC